MDPKAVDDAIEKVAKAVAGVTIGEDGAPVAPTASAPSPTPVDPPAAPTASKKPRRNKKKNKKKNKGDKGDKSEGGVGGGGGGGSTISREMEAMAAPDADEEEETTAEKAKRTAEFLELLGQRTRDDRLKPKASDEFKFWSKQPVPKLDEVVEKHGPIDEEKTIDDIRAEPLNLPKGFKWSTIDVTKEEQLKELYELLSTNYVEDDDSMFRFDYPPEFLKWALTSPNFFHDWHVGVRNEGTGALLGFISGIPVEVQVYEKKMVMCEINFLCVHKRLRAKRLAPVLIKEVTRRVNRRGMFQAVYTAGVVLPKPVSACRYWHRSLRPKKLVDIRFSSLPRRLTMARALRLYKLPTEHKIPGFRAMEKKDVKQVTKILNAYLSKFKLRMVFSEDDVAHWLLPRDGVVNSYVVPGGSGGEITDFTSFYHLPSTVIGHARYKDLRAVYSFYNVPGEHSLKDLMHEALVAASNLECDVFNALDLMENESFLKDLKFGEGDGHLQYYLYNWACPQMDNASVGLVLL